MHVSKRIRVENSRLGFPHIWRPTKFGQDDDDSKPGRYEVSLLLPENDPQRAEIQAVGDALIAESKVKVPAGNTCFKDGNDYSYDGFPGNWCIKASTKHRPVVVGKNRSAVVENGKEAPYAGCYVNALIGFWIQDNPFGKRLNCNLYIVQFFADGEPFGEGPVDAATLMGEMGDVLSDGEDL